MSFAVVNIETEDGERIELALPLDVPSGTLGPRIMGGFGRLVRTGEKYALHFKTGRGDKPIPPDSTLGELGVRDGQVLRIRRQRAGAAPAAPRAHAYLQTTSGKRIALEQNHVILGRKDPKQQFPLDLDLTAFDPGKVVSRQHATIGRDGRKYYILDLESTNGTRVNGVTALPGRKVDLKSGDAVDFGLQVRFTFLTAEAEGDKSKASQRGKTGS